MHITFCFLGFFPQIYFEYLIKFFLLYTAHPGKQLNLKHWEAFIKERLKSMICLNESICSPVNQNEYTLSRLKYISVFAGWLFDAKLFAWCVRWEYAS